MSGNSRRKRKPDHTFKYVQQNENADEKTNDANKKEGGNSKGAGKGKAGKGVVEEPSEADSYEPPNKKEAGKEDKKAGEAEPEPEPAAAAKQDPYDCLSDADRKLMQTDILEFLKRFAPKFYVPVYKTWTIPKSAVH